MRRPIAALGVLAAVGALCLTLPGAASAAPGELIVNGQVITDPSGCYPFGNPPLTVQNNTSAVAYVFSSSNCTGRAEVVQAGDSIVSTNGHSVRIS
ncbi:hypothetical protein [Streptomyces sp. SID3343]|uniref:hypothetical protein n=1 Tax=Streptomyces sp. SID3343 TaxID=2690260 RepID=UPI0013684400|nr:hypothetical protein [Streptomyces sp. SID3343]MYV98990.1 hypothetical protein [Streptomyces sp. SID3343]